jgi:hypothetical protein
VRRKPSWLVCLLKDQPQLSRRAAAGDDEYPKSLPASSPHTIAFSAATVLDQHHVRHGTVDTAAQLHVCRGARCKGQPILLKGITGDTVSPQM